VVDFCIYGLVLNVNAGAVCKTLKAGKVED